MSDGHQFFRLRVDRGIRGVVPGIVVATLCCTGLGRMSPALAQPAENAFATWKDVEVSPQFKDVVTALRGGGPFNDAAREFLSTAILPQFESEDNLPSLDDVRKKIRDRLLLVIGNDDSFAQAGTFVRDRLDEFARDTNRDPLLRVNAMLFIGEMTDKGRLPWATALSTLAAAAQDAALDPAVRIAALTGLSNHLASLTRLSGDQATAVRAAIAATLPTLLPPSAAGNPAGGVEPRSHAASWLAARGLGMLPLAVNPATPEIAARLVAVIDDPSWPFDVRVRAAAALGKTVGAESGVATEPVLKAIRTLAIAALDADRLEARRLLELQAYKAGGGAGAGGAPGFVPRGPMPEMGGMPGMGGELPAEDGLRSAVCRRAAWRLYALGDAIVPDSKKGGLAALIDKDGDGAKQLAALLKDGGEALDAEPYGYVLLEALDELDPDGVKKRAAEAAPAGAADEPEAPAPTEPAAPGKDKPAPKPAKKPDSPFGDSPF
jgi:hypothetical protein